MTSFSPEMIEKAREAKSAEELLKMARENGIELSPMEAKTYFSQLNPKSGELDDDDLDNVAGGLGGCFSFGNSIRKGAKVRVLNGQKCRKCGSDIGYYQSGAGATYVACINDGTNFAVNVSLNDLEEID
jgi:hypothetical protein